LAKEFIELKQFAAIWVLFIVMPLSNGIAFHRLRSAASGLLKSLRHVFVAFGRNGFTSPAAGNKRSHALAGEALVFSRKLEGSAVSLARTCNELHREDSRSLDCMNLSAKSQRKFCPVAGQTELPEELNSATGNLESLGCAHL
jgi:hypothetical protein